MLICPRPSCQTENTDDSKFCQGCGESIKIPTAKAEVSRLKRLRKSGDQRAAHLLEVIRGVKSKDPRALEQLAEAISVGEIQPAKAFLKALDATTPLDPEHQEKSAQPPDHPLPQGSLECIACGAGSPPDSKFCLGCGRQFSSPVPPSLPGPPQASPVPPPQASSSSALQLISLDGERQFSFNLGTKLNSNWASRLGPDAQFWDRDWQMELENIDGRWYLIPNPNAVNETLLNNEAVRSKIEINSDDVIGVGKSHKNIVKTQLRVSLLPA